MNLNFSYLEKCNCIEKFSPPCTAKFCNSNVKRLLEAPPLSAFPLHMTLYLYTNFFLSIVAIPLLMEVVIWCCFLQPKVQKLHLSPSPEVPPFSSSSHLRDFKRVDISLLRPHSMQQSRHQAVSFITAVPPLQFSELKGNVFTPGPWACLPGT